MKKRKRKEFTFPALIFMGAGFALVTVMAMAILLAAVAYFTADPTAMIGEFSLIALILSGAVSAFVTSRVNGEGGTLIGIVSSVIAALLMLSVGLVWRGGLLPLGAVLNVLAFTVTSCAFALLGKKRKKRKSRYIS